MKRKLQMQEMRQQEELRGGIPVRGTTVLDQNILKPELEHYHQESAIEMFKVFSATEKKSQAQVGDSGGKRESYLFDERLVSMQNDAITAVQAATDTVTEMAINGTGVNEAIAVVLKAAKAVAALAETEDAEEEALVVREKLKKLHKLQEVAAKMRQDKAKVVEKAEGAKVVELR